MIEIFNFRKPSLFEKIFTAVCIIVLILFFTLGGYVIASVVKDIHFSNGQCQSCSATGIEGYDNYCYHCGAEIEKE